MMCDLISVTLANVKRSLKVTEEDSGRCACPRVVHPRHIMRLIQK